MSVRVDNLMADFTSVRQDAVEAAVAYPHDEHAVAAGDLPFDWFVQSRDLGSSLNLILDKELEMWKQRASSIAGAWSCQPAGKPSAVRS